jgi:hypothetical protein
MFVFQKKKHENELKKVYEKSNQSFISQLLGKANEKMSDES